MYYVVHDWMSTELGLKGTEKEIYAIIYGFSQDGESEFYGNLEYLVNLTGVSRKTVIDTLAKLTERGLLKKTVVSGSTNRYTATRVEITPVKKLHPTRVEITPNNIDNNINNTVSKDTGVRKKSLFEKCSDVIEEEFTDIDIKNELRAFLTIRIKSGKLSSQSFRSIVCEVNDLAETKEQALEIIRNATAKGYMKFYPVNKQKKKNVYQDNLQKIAETDESKLRDKYREEMSLLMPWEKIPYEEWKGENK